MEVMLVDVTYRYKNSSRDSLVSINMNISGPSITGITGVPGSGKTTLLGIISDVIKPTAGKVYIQPKDVLMVFQNPANVFSEHTVFGEICKHTRSKDARRVLASLKMVRLDDSYLYMDPFCLSESEQRLVCIASVLAANPKIIVFDEPFRGLDDNNKKYMIKLFKMMKYRYNKMILVASIDTDLLDAICDTVYVMKDGEVVCSGDKYEVLSNEKIMVDSGLCSPKTLEFSNLVKRMKNVNLGKRNDINDLIKDIYRKAR